MIRAILRADGDSQVGLGHVYRLLAFAEMLDAEFEVSFAIRRPAEYLCRLIEEAGFTHVALPDFTNYEQEARALGPEIYKDALVILDGYYFNSEYQKNIKGIR